MNYRADSAGEQFMKMMQDLGYVSLCSYTDPDGALGECATEIIADPADAEIVEIMLAMLVADYAELCGWTREDLLQFIACIANDAMAEMFGVDAERPETDETDGSRVVHKPGGPTLRVLPGRKRDDNR